MPEVVCSLCGKEMVIDEIDGEPYVTEEDGSIHHVVCPEPEEEPTPTTETTAS
jgi:hypothetical protein